MANELSCPICQAVLEINTDEISVGDLIECEECDATLEVLTENPLTLRSYDQDEDFEDEDESEEE